MSQVIAALEADVGETLIDRSVRGLRLTEVGRTLHAHAREVLAALDAARDALSRLDAVVTGSVRVGTSDTWATHLLPPVFSAFRRAHPGVELRLDNRPSPAMVAMEMSSLEVLKRLVELDFGVSVVPELAVRDEVLVGRLVTRPLVGAERRMVGLLLPASPSRAAIAFADLARHVLGK